LGSQCCCISVHCIHAASNNCNVIGVIRQTYLDQVATGTQSGYIGGANQYLADAQIARDVVAGLAGTVLYGTDGKPIVADGSELHVFQASKAQYNDSQLLLSNTTSTLIKQFGSVDAANNAQATQSRWDNLTLAGVRSDRKSALLNAYQQPSEGVATSALEAYVIGTGGLAKSLVSAAVDAGKAGLGAVGRAGVESAINSRLTLRVPVPTMLPDGTVLNATATPARILVGGLEALLAEAEVLFGGALVPSASSVSPKSESSPLGTIRSEWQSWASNQFMTIKCNHLGAEALWFLSNLLT
jgi:hypothetical protein